MNASKKLLIAVIAVVMCGVMLFSIKKVQKMYINAASDGSKISQTEQKKNTEKNKNNDTKGESTKDIKAGKDTDSEKDAQKDAAKSEAEKKAEDKEKAAKAEENEETEQIKKTENDETAQKKENGKESAGSTQNSVIIIIDAVDGNKTILNQQFNIEGRSAGYITQKMLDNAGINYRTTGSASTMYVSSIAGIEQLKAGPYSGWCYYIKKKGTSKYVKPNVGCGQYICEKGDSIMWKYVADGSKE